jgi:hypothetical protein
MIRPLLLNIILLLLLAVNLPAQSVKLVYNSDYATIQFVKKLLDQGPSTEKDKYFVLRGLDLHTIHFLDSLRLDYLSYNLRYYDYPVGQKMPLSFFRLMEKYILDETPQMSYRTYAEGIIPEEYIAQYERMLYLFKPIYQEIVEKPYDKQIKLAMQLLNTMMEDLDVTQKLHTIAGFYGVKMKDYVIAIYPVLDNLLTTGTSFLNRGEVALPIIHVDPRQAISTLVHEISHLFYSDMSSRMKRVIDATVVNSPWNGSRYANWLMDEVIATAVGNGWAYREMFNSEESGSWYYRNHYVSEASKIIHPLVSQYIKAGRSIDIQFINSYLEKLDRSVRRWMRDWDFLLQYREVRVPSYEYLTMVDMYYPFYYYRRYLIDNRLDEMLPTTTKMYIFSDNYEEEWKDVQKYLGEFVDSIPDFSKPFVKELVFIDRSKIILIHGDKAFVEATLQEHASWYQYQKRRRNAKR